MLNTITIQGRLTADPETKSIPSGTHLISMTVACERPRNKDGESVTDFIPCIAWAKNADFIQKYFHKGDMIVILGRLQSRNYETADGKKRTAYEVSVSEANFCGGARTQKAEGAQGMEDDYDDIDWDKVPDLPEEFA